MADISDHYPEAQSSAWRIPSGPPAKTADATERRRHASLLTLHATLKKESSMALIGTFVPTPNGFTGRIQTLLLDAEVTLSEIREPIGDNPPDYLITLGKHGEGSFIGTGRKRKMEKGGAFISIRIDDPALSQPMFAGLFPAEKSNALFNLYWTRVNRQGDRP
jgi:uncharacterized protein (DUF736 family)